MKNISLINKGVIFAALLFVFTIAAEAQKKAVEAPDAPKVIGPYSQAIIANGFVFAAGQIGSDPKTGQLVEGGIEEQTEQVLKNIAAVLKASGSSMEDAVKTTVFLADINDFAKMNEIYARHFKSPFPARSTVQVARLPRDAKIEIEVVALVSKPGKSSKTPAEKKIKMKLDIFQVDAFTSKPFGGNPAAIVPLDKWLDAGIMQNIALENNLSETAFFVNKDDVYEIRWFTPTYEIDLCGHATLASAFVIFEVLKLESKTVKFHSHKSGALNVEKIDDLLVLDFPSRPVSPVAAPQGLADAIGKKPKEIFKARDYFLVYESEQEILDIKPNFSKLLEIDAHGFIVTAKGDTADFVSRFFAPEVGVFEDPVTGSAHCNLIPFWAERLGKTEMFAKQVSARGGELFCELKGERVKIGGNAVLYLKGEIFV